MISVQRIIDRSLVEPKNDEPAWVASTAFTGGAEKSAPGARHAGSFSVRELLEWAFSVEHASVEFGEEFSAGGHMPGRGSEASLIEMAQLGGVQIDTSRGTSTPDEDADIIADLVASCLTKGMAIRVAELARSGRVPDWMEGATPRCVPVEMRRNQHGTRAATKVIGYERRLNRRGRMVDEPILICPVTYCPTQSQIAAARRKYLDWWGALLTLRQALKSVGLSHHRVTDVMPASAPWKKQS